MKVPDFDLENEDIPLLEPSGIFKLWMYLLRIVALLFVFGGIGVVALF